ncbi:MAG: B12-binding domain-containing radical SAM protein [Nitrososphaerota archaeon]|jgi:radical SAM superfamily enzyme YgiQ (UPF0313 family)|nr:B12-binding domain-containing radical SAM protein [Nitrososphaerota archaeon]
MKIALVGAEFEENLGLRYIASSLETKGHQTEIFPFNSIFDRQNVIQAILTYKPDIVGLSMVFTSRAREFLNLSNHLKNAGYNGHIVAGGHFASFNSKQLLTDYPSITSVATGEGENLMVTLTNHLNEPGIVPGLCYRNDQGNIVCNPLPLKGNTNDLDLLPFPKRGSFHKYFGKKICNLVSSRGCWRNCAFCSICTWYEQIGGKKFRYRHIDNIVAEMKQLYDHEVRIFNFQDDNFFLPDQYQAIERFKTLRQRLREEKIDDVAIQIKARPESINKEAIEILRDMGLFRVFLGVENASNQGLKNLNRLQTIDQTVNALTILNDFDIHVEYNFLMFEPDVTMEDILCNIRFMGRYLENPFNFCRAEIYAGTGLATKLTAENRLMGDYFGFTYQIKEPKCEMFYQVANYAFFDRNFSVYGLHYFNTEISVHFQLLRYFYPSLITETLRCKVKDFIKQVNLDTYHWLCVIYDFINGGTHSQEERINFARQIRSIVDLKGKDLYLKGQTIFGWMEKSYEKRHDQNGFVHSSIIDADLQSFTQTSANNDEEHGLNETLDSITTSSDVVPCNSFIKELKKIK